jgi:hypothetical protein
LEELLLSVEQEDEDEYEDEYEDDDIQLDIERQEGQI